MVIMFLPVFCSLLTAIHSANTLSQSNFLPSLLAFCLSLVPSRPKCVSASTDHLIKKLKNMLCGQMHIQVRLGIWLNTRNIAHTQHWAHTHSSSTTYAVAGIHTSRDFRTSNYCKGNDCTDQFCVAEYVHIIHCSTLTGIHPNTICECNVCMVWKSVCG